MANEASAVPEAGELFGLPEDEFVPARNQLVRTLRKAGRREDAAAVATLRRPPRAAWALNQAARRQPDLARSAVAAGLALRQANEAAIAGRAGDLRGAMAASRAASDQLVAAAVAIVGPAGEGLRPVLDGIVRAAAADDDVAGRLEAGLLDDIASPPGFDFATDVAVADLAPRTPRTPRTRRSTPPAADDAPVPHPASATTRVGATAVERRRAEAAARAARRRELERARQELDRVSKHLERLRARADEAHERWQLAQGQLAQAEAEHAEAQARVAELDHQP